MLNAQISDNQFTVLLVEDDDIDAMVVTRMFDSMPGELSVDVHRARDGREGLSMLHGFVDRGISRLILLVDIDMPRMNGLELLTAIRAEPALEATVIFMMTTSTEPSDVAAAYNENVAGYIEKPAGATPVDRVRDFLTKYARNVIFPTPRVAPPRQGQLQTKSSGSAWQASEMGGEGAPRTRPDVPTTPLPTSFTDGDRPLQGQHGG